MIGGAVLAIGLPALAEAAPDAQEVTEVVITGSRIKRAETDTPSPVVVVDPQVMQDRGFIQAGQALNQITSNVPSFPQAKGDGSAAGNGQQFANLFGLGAGRTLTLVNGRRMVTTSQSRAVSGVDGLGDRVVDTNVIPTGLIKRVDVVQAGGASVYGSDAIAGVINYVLKDRFEGLELDAQYGESTYGDYPSRSLRATFGKNFLDGRGNIAVDVEWSKTDPLLDYDRPRSNLARVAVANPLNVSNTDGVPAITGILDARFTSFNYNGLLFSPAPAPLTNFIFKAGGITQQFNATGDALVPYNTGTVYSIPFSAGGDGFTYRELASLYVGVERFSANMIGHYDLTDHMKISGEVLVARVAGRDPYANLASNTVLNSAASGSGAIPISRANPYLSSAVLAAIGPGGPPLYLSKAWTDLLMSREAVNRTDTARAVISLDGDFELQGRDFYYSVSASRAQTDGEQRGWGIWTSHFNNAVQAVRNGAGAIVCGVNADAIASNDDPACVPINPFGSGNVTSAARAYVNQRIGQDYLNTQDDYLATIGGDLFALPAGKVKFSLGYEHRREEAKFVPTLASQLGLTGIQSPVAATRGEYSTNEYSAEVLVPVFGGDFTLPLVKTLEFDGSYRRVDNSIAGQEDVWGAGGRWELFSGLTFRASRSRNFRAPNLDQLFAPSSTGLNSVGPDPCDFRYISSGPAPATRLANCKALFAAHPGYGSLATFQDSAVNFSTANVTTSGNPNLRNEISDTTTYGVIIQPPFIPGLTIVADRIEVDLENGLSAFTPTNFMATCYDSTVQPVDVCSTFTRDAAGNVITAKSTTFNAGKITFRGETYNVDYTFPLNALLRGGEEDKGQVDLSLEVTHTAKLETSVTGFDLTRTDGTTANPDWVTRFDARYTKGPLRLTYSMIHLPDAKVNLFDTIESTPTPSISGNTRHSVSASYQFKNYTFRAGVINLGNEQPSYPTRNYGDILGRQWFVGLKANF